MVQDLTFECILGADFLSGNKAVMDFRTNTLHLGNHTTVIVPASQTVGAQVSDAIHNIFVHAPEDLQVPARSVRLVNGVLPSGFCREAEVEEGLVEPAAVGLPKHLCVARSMGKVSSNGSVLLHVMNVSPTTVTEYKGTTLAEFVPHRNIALVNDSVSLSVNSNSNVLEPDLNSSDLTEVEKQELRSLLKSFGSLFVSEDGSLGRTSAVRHGISTSGNPIRQPIRCQTESLKSVVNTEVEKMLSKGVIRQSSSPWSSPVVMVKKKNGSWRFCIDYRKMNAATHQDAYPLPRIDATLESLAGSTLFTTLDLASGYWQVEIEDRDKEKTAFSTEKGHFEFNVMPFGLTNAPATFQRLMECVLAGLNGEQCLIYIDDIIVFSRTFSEHLDRLHKVFSKLEEAGLKLQTSKCHFAQKVVRYLGHEVSADGIRPDPAKTEAVSNYPVPRNAKELKQFMGLSNYYRRFVKDYSKIAEPLFKLLTKEGVKNFSWSSSCQSAFDDLKERLISPPILAYPDFKKPFYVHTDASDFAIGAVLCQIQQG